MDWHSWFKLSFGFDLGARCYCLSNPRGNLVKLCLLQIEAWVEGCFLRKGVEGENNYGISYDLFRAVATHEDRGTRIPKEYAMIAWFSKSVFVQRPFAIAVTYWIALIIIAHFFAPPGYAWTQNTISELASQGHSYKWIMQSGLIGFGVLMMLVVGWLILKTKRMISPLLPVALYGLAILLAGIYCTAPINPTIPYLASESQLHSIFATLAGVTLSVAIFWSTMVASSPGERLVHALFFIAVIGFSILYALTENAVLEFGEGIVQRLLYLSGFIWLISQRYEAYPVLVELSLRPL